MESRRLELVLVWLYLVFVSQIFGKYYLLNLNPDPNGWREKRQSHPQTTIARIPEVAFAEARALPGLVEYLTPPPLGDSLTAAAHNVQAYIGFDANELLTPPSDQARQYNTLKVFSLVPAASAAESLPPQDGTEFDTSGASSSEDFTSQEYRRDQRAPKSSVPVYTYVKTDKHGHFKWGVRHGN